MYVKEKSIVTALIWIIVAVILISVLTTPFNNSNVDGTALVAILGVVAALSTRFIWNSTLGMENAIRDYMQHDLQQQGKAKRTGNERMHRLLEELDEDELDDLRAQIEAEQARYQ